MRWGFAVVGGSTVNKSAVTSEVVVEGDLGGGLGNGEIGAELAHGGS